MKPKLIALLLIAVMLVCFMPIAVFAEVTPPTVLSAPVHFGVSHYSGDYVKYTFGAPEDLKVYIEKRAEDDLENKRTFTAYLQIDYKIDGGSWHHTSEWDSPKTVPDRIDDLYFTFISGKEYIDSDSRSMTALFPEDETLKAFAVSGGDYLKSHSITFRARFAQSFDNGDTYVLSPWSKEYTLSVNPKAGYDKLINHAPTLLSAQLRDTGKGEPHFDIKLAALPDEVADLHSMAGNSVRTEVWMRRAEDKEFKYIEYEWAHSEALDIEASDYFGDTKQSYDAESYEIKVRYALDLRNYKQSGYYGSGSSVDIYSPFSNVISQNMPAWSNASGWAETEVKKALDNGLYPDKLRGADLTKPITRAEFAAVALKLYESLSGKTASPAPASTFTDTRDTDILKAYALDIVAGVGNNKYAPDELLNREQAATMLTRVYKKVYWEGWTLAGDNTYTKHSLDNKGVAPFADDAQISGYAKPSVYFMAKYDIIRGSNGNRFAPRNTTSAEAATGFANTTREQALAISNRTFEKADEIQDGGPTAAAPSVQTPPSAQTTTQQGNEENTTQVGEFTSADLTGEWSRGGAYSVDYINGNIDIGTMSIVNGEYYKFNADGTFRSVISTLGGYAGYVRYDSIVVYETGKYKIDGNKIIFSDRIQTYYKGTPLVLVHKDKKLDYSDELIIEEFDKEGKRFKTMLGWLEKSRQH